jgi:hypothetical protein
MTTDQQCLVKSWLVGVVICVLFVVFLDNRPISFGVFALGTLILRSLRRGIDTDTFRWIPTLSPGWQLLVAAYYCSLAIGAFVLASRRSELITGYGRVQFSVLFAVLIFPLLVVSIKRDIKLFTGGSENDT